MSIGEIRSAADIDREVGRVRELAPTEPEKAHAIEDELRAAVLEAIARGLWRDTPQAMAAAAVKTKEIEFERHYERKRDVIEPSPASAVLPDRLVSSDGGGRPPRLRREPNQGSR